MLKVSTKNGAVILPVKVVPGASRTAYQGEWDGYARIAVAAPPEQGKANGMLIKYLAKLLGVRKCDLTLLSGRSAPLKTIRIERTTEASVLEALSSAGP